MERDKIDTPPSRKTTGWIGHERLLTEFSWNRDARRFDVTLDDEMTVRRATVGFDDLRRDVYGMNSVPKSEAIVDIGGLEICYSGDSLAKLLRDVRRYQDEMAAAEKALAAGTAGDDLVSEIGRFLARR